MEIYYINSSGQRIDFTGGAYKMLSVSELFNYGWKYTTKGSYMPSIASFNKSFVEKSLSIGISAKSKEEYYYLISELLSIIDRDVKNATAGRLYVNNTFLRCFFTGSTKPKRYVNTQRTVIEFTILAEKDEWTEETTSKFGGATSEEFSGEWLDYEHDYPYDYVNSLTNKILVNDSYSPSDFVLTIYGSCVNPTISIGTNVYKLNAGLTTGEYVEISSENRTIYKTMNNGTKVNLFNERDRENDIFTKVPDGTNVVAWDGTFGFDVTLLTKRSEPRWI